MVNLNHCPGISQLIIVIFIFLLQYFLIDVSENSALQWFFLNKSYVFKYILEMLHESLLEIHETHGHIR